MTRRMWLASIATALTYHLTPTALLAQSADGFRLVEPAPAAGDKAGNWTLYFRYAPPRIITVDVPGKGSVTAWYMVYQLYNRTENPQSVTSLKFELVTKDLNTTHVDEVQPALFKAIAAKEDPENNLKLLTTVQMTQTPIPVTKQDSYPRYVSGLAIWTDVPKTAATTNKFSVYVGGISDGLVAEDREGGAKLIKVKTLQLDFFKPTDNNRPGIVDIKPEDNNGLGGERWIYRPSRIRGAAVAEKSKDGN